MTSNDVSLVVPAAYLYRLLSLAKPKGEDDRALLNELRAALEAAAVPGERTIAVPRLTTAQLLARVDAEVDQFEERAGQG